MESDPASLSPLALRRAFGTHPTGVVAIAALRNGLPLGLAASSFVSISLDPPLAAMSFAHASTTWPTLRQAPRLGVSVLAAHQAEAGRQLSVVGVDRFLGLGWQATEEGAVFLDDSAAHFDCSIDRQVSTGDHDIVVLAIHRAESNPEVMPLVFHDSRFTAVGDRRDAKAPVP